MSCDTVISEKCTET